MEIQYDIVDKQHISFEIPGYRYSGTITIKKRRLPKYLFNQQATLTQREAIPLYIYEFDDDLQPLVCKSLWTSNKLKPIYKYA